MGVYKEKGECMKNVRLEVMVKKAQTIASLPFEYNPKDTTLRGSATPNHAVGSKRNSWLNRAKREWRKNSDMYLTQFFLIFFVGAWAFAVVVIGVK